MRNTNGQNVCLNDSLLKTVDGSTEPKVPTPLNASESEFIDYIKFHGIDEFIKSLRMIHDFALYHTDLCFDKEEKSALFDLKILWEGFEQITKS
ncbi:hypothetical protein QQ020_27165 [Fulvivirgaceae bacterium BMA12]|uniref:Uncharacterized protein n=1 Tax=Agaribacillus aureus TaxID=3051825 RepID=A0ABT8LDC9_9BACT|nr:hypothetical protein [Fulvivirgaceae bacterium BMA12]